MKFYLFWGFVQNLLIISVVIGVTIKNDQENYRKGSGILVEHKKDGWRLGHISIVEQIRLEQSDVL